MVATGQYLPVHAQLSRPKLSQPKLPRLKLRDKDPGPPCAAFEWEPITSSEEELWPQLVGDLVDLNGHVLAALDSPVDEARDCEGHVLAGKEEHQRVGSSARLKSVLGTSIY